METPTKAALLEQHARNDPRRFYEFVGFDRVDANGHDMLSQLTWELREIMQGQVVSVLINTHASKDDVVVLLRKIADWIDDLPGLVSVNPDDPLAAAIWDALCILDTFKSGSGA